MVYPAKVDRWLAALIGGAALLLLAAAALVLVVGLSVGDPEPQAVLGMAAVFAGLGLFTGLILWGCYRTRYEVASSDLIVRVGPFRWTLPLERIVEVFPTRDPLSAPAPSLDRLRINYRRVSGRMWFVLISPKDKNGFVRDLASAAPQLTSTADGSLRLKAEELG
ncbi:MAG TPA: PH domain-containing protein [Gemmataceae bacterium]|nr:PH domain-containing protein [Gemmataceae bacterium]